MAAFTDLSQFPQWVVWRYGADRNGTRAKIPYDPRIGGRASVTDPRTWATLDDASRAVDRYEGLGFVLTSHDPFVGIDLDHCRDPKTGVIEPWAQNIVTLVWSYTEVTPSKTGLRIFLRGSLPAGGRKRGRVEMYDDGRFLTVTGLHLPGTPDAIEDRDQEIHELHAHWFPDVNPLPRDDDASPPTVEPVEMEDENLLAQAFTRPNGARFEALWKGDISGYASPSEADLALVSWLGHLTGGKAQRVDRLFRRSRLFRPKWDEQHGATTYGQRTIAKALANNPAAVPSAQQAWDIRCAADIIPRQMTWLWPGRIPAGKLALIIGDPGMGKSLLTVDITARVTTGEAWPDGGGAPLGSVLILSSEDDPEDTIVPRLISAGADLSRVFFIQPGHDGSSPDLSKDLARLRTEIEKRSISVVVVDPLSAYLGRTDSWKDAEVRSLLSPVAAMASEIGVTIIGLLHLTKDTQRKAIHRALGSIALTAASRAVFTVAMDPNADPEDPNACRWLVPVKLNVAAKPPTLAFHLSKLSDSDPPVLAWEPTPVAGVDVDHLLSSTGGGGDHEARRDAEDFLRDLLSDGRLTAGHVLDAARQDGIAKRTLYRAKAKLGVKSVYDGQPGNPGRWFWYPPEAANARPDSAHLGNVAISTEHREETP